MLRLLTVLSLSILVSACVDTELRKDYLQSRVSEPLQIPDGMDQGLLKAGSMLDGLSEEELKELDPDALIKPPKIVEQVQSPHAGKSAGSGLKVNLKRDDNNVSFLFIEADYDLVWREIHLSLVATGFTLTDMNRTDGLFYIRYRDPDDEREEYALQLIRAAGGSRVLVRSPEGQILATEAAGRILTLLKANL